MPLAKLKSKTNSVKHSMISKNEVTENHNFRLMKMGRVHIRRAVQNELGASVFGKKKGSQGVNTQSIQRLSFFPLLKIYAKTVRTYHWAQGIQQLSYDTCGTSTQGTWRTMPAL